MRHTLYISVLLGLTLYLSGCDLVEVLAPEAAKKNETGGRVETLPGVPGKLNSFGVNAEGNVYLTIQGSFHAFAWEQGSSAFTPISGIQAPGDPVSRRTRVSFTPDGTCYLTLSYDGEVPQARAKDSLRVFTIDGLTPTLHASITINEVAELNFDYWRINLQGDFFPVGSSTTGELVYFDKQTEAFIPIANTSLSEVRMVFVQDDVFYVITQDDRMLAVDPASGAATEVFAGQYTSIDLRLAYDRLSIDGSAYGLVSGSRSLFVWETGSPQPLIYGMDAPAGLYNLQLYPLRDGKFYATAWNSEYSACEEQIFELRLENSTYVFHPIREDIEPACEYMASLQLQDGYFYVPTIQTDDNISRVHRFKY